MAKVYLLTGGNVGDSLKTLQKANALIQQRVGSIIKSSSIYKTAAWGKTDQDDFLNQVLLVETGLDPYDLMDALLDIEMLLGRKRLEKFGPRIIDLDILFYEDIILKTDRLTIPHPQIQFRRFVLEPLNEIVPELVHPILKKNINRLLMECTDLLKVSLLY
ncbi:MAG: 2-amino-4-hydroxy-6-hydroxymethyldihydropteridine diphosphokinase [Flavitalea sp.]